MANTRLVIYLLWIGGVISLLVRRFSDYGAFNKAENFNTESCRVIANFSTCEDLQIDYSNDLLYLSANDWPPFLQGKSVPNGGIYTLDLKQKDAQPKLISIDQPTIFHPHGFHLYTDPQTGERVLFVVNHNEKGHSSIEIFDVIDRDTLKHRETHTHEGLTSANEILGVGKRAFYVTQDTRYAMGSLQLFFASVLSMENGGLFHFDGKNWKTVLEGLHFGNGLAVSPDGKYLYVAETNKGRVRVYDGNIQSGDVNFKTSYALDNFPDNIYMDDKGSLWVSGFSNLFKVSERLKGKDVAAPVKIMRAEFDGDQLKDLKTMLTTTGEEILAITAVVPYKDKIIISGIVAPEVRICDVPKDAPSSEIHSNTDL